MESIEGMSQFFQQWCVDAGRIRKTFSEAEICTESRKSGEVETIIEDAEKECAILRAMKQSSDAAVSACSKAGTRGKSSGSSGVKASKRSKVTAKAA